MVTIYSDYKNDIPVTILIPMGWDMPPDEKDPTMGIGSALRLGGNAFGSSNPCNFFLMRCIAMENSFLSIFPSLFISARVL